MPRYDIFFADNQNKLRKKNALPVIWDIDTYAASLYAHHVIYMKIDAGVFNLEQKLLSLDKMNICCGINQIYQTVNNHTHVHDINNGMACIEIIADNLEATD